MSVKLKRKQNPSRFLEFQDRDKTHLRELMLNVKAPSAVLGSA